jgi:hypothetical protein
MKELFRRGEVLPEGRTNEEETKLVEQEEVAPVRAEPTPLGVGRQIQAAVRRGGA